MDSMTFVGYSDDRKAYRFLNLQTNRITESRVAHFVEHRNGSHELEAEESNPEIGDDGWTFPASGCSPQEESSGHEEQPLENSSDDQNRNRKQPQEEQPESPNESSGGSEEEYYGCEDQEAVDSPGPRYNLRPNRGKLPGKLEDFVVEKGKLVEEDPSSYSAADLVKEFVAF